MKKIFTLGLAVLMLALAIISCDPKPESEDPKDSGTASTPSIPIATVNTSPDAPFNGEDDSIG